MKNEMKNCRKTWRCRGVCYLPRPNLLLNLHISPRHTKAESNDIILSFIQHIHSLKNACWNLNQVPGAVRCTKPIYCIILLCEVYYTHVCYCVRASDHRCVLCDVQCNTRLAIHLIHVLWCTSSSSLNSYLPVPDSFRMTQLSPSVNWTICTP